VSKFEKSCSDIPELIKGSLFDPNECNQLPADVVKAFESTGLGMTVSVVDQDDVAWIGTSHGVVRIDLSERVKEDQIQYFSGPRYLYDRNNHVKALTLDGDQGVWVLTQTGISHIEMKPLSYTEKAIHMSDHSQMHVNRRGIVSDSIWSEGKWKPVVTDNDGLWTSMYAAGECFRYGVQTDPEQKVIARRIAVKSVEAVLLIANIPARDGYVDAKIRHYVNTFINSSNEMSKEYVKKNGDPVYCYPKEGPVGMKLEKLLNTIDTHKPRTPEDWVMEGDARTKKRLMKGFMARTYLIDGLEQVPLGGLYFKKMIKGDKMIAKARPFDPGSGPDDPKRVGYNLVNNRARMVEDFAGIETDASCEVPERLARLYRTVTKEDGTFYSDADVWYKADTSTDEIIGHLFLYKIAYDLLCTGEHADFELGELIVSTTCNLAPHIFYNDYCLVDATGQPTTWGKMSREYFSSLFAWSDCPLNCLVLLSIFKLAYYFTKDEKWEKEYRKLALEAPYQYADLAGEYRERYKQEAVYFFKKENPDADKDDPRLDPDSFETAKAVQVRLNYSDEEMAMLAYYLLFQMEADPVILEKYRKGIDTWWISIKYSDNPLWMYIYQLAYPKDEGKVDLERAAWSLKRHPVDTRCWKADNSFRNDIIDYMGKNKAMSAKEDGWFVALPLDERPHGKYNGCPFAIRGGADQGERLESSATYTLPYWMGRFHRLIHEE
ncbi:MAG TPA: hypothetical protein DDZ89_21870, partial [Clostridiales bacterium]|nr:hypothetical protein [Clostridiales bacterium]